MSKKTNTPATTDETSEWRADTLATIHGQIRDSQNAVANAHLKGMVDALKEGLTPEWVKEEGNNLAAKLNDDNGFGKAAITNSEHSANLARILKVNRQGALNFIVNALANCGDSKEGATQINDAMSLIDELKPRDAYETLLISQMVATHASAMRMLGRMNQQTYADPFNRYMNTSTKLMRLFGEQMKSLTRYRTAGKQTVEVKHVHVGDGGQAIVGNVSTGGTSKK